MLLFQTFMCWPRQTRSNSQTTPAIHSVSVNATTTSWFSPEESWRGSCHATSIVFFLRSVRCIWHSHLGSLHQRACRSEITFKILCTRLHIKAHYKKKQTTNTPQPKAMRRPSCEQDYHKGRGREYWYMDNGNVCIWYVYHVSCIIVHSNSIMYHVSCIMYHVSCIEVL